MSEIGGKAHWERAYSDKGEAGVSWFEEDPRTSLELLDGISAGPDSAFIDIGGGASRLVDALVEKGWGDLTVLDLSEQALDLARTRLGEAGKRVSWIAADVTRWRPERSYDIWHDRAAFHFLVEEEERKAYRERLGMALKPGAHAIIATFAADGPERCSGLPVMRYDAEGLADAMGSAFTLVAERRQAHRTPWGAEQSFQFAVLRKVVGG